MSNKTLSWALVVVALVAIIGVFTPLGKNVSGLVGTVGVSSVTNFSGTVGIQALKIGPTCGDNYTFASCAGEVINGGILSTSTPASMTLAPADMNYGYISMYPGTTAGITVTLPATTTTGMSSFLPNAGDTTRIVIFNSTTTAQRSITIAAGTGTLLETASSSAATVAPATVGSSRAATMTCARKVDTDIVCMLNPYI